MHLFINGFTTVDVYAVGDYDLNGKAFEEADIKAIKHAIENPEKLSTSEKYASDINGDGRLSEEDLTQLTAIYGEATGAECADNLKVYYRWGNKYSTCTATAMCTLCGETYATETVKTKSETITESTCTQDGKTKYTATFKNELFEEQTKTVTVKASHDYENGVCTQCGMGHYTYDQETNTYTVYHVDGLYAWNTAAQTDLSTNLVLMADITLPNTDLATGEEITVENGVPSGSNWTPVGTSSSPYQGSIDGNNHTISGLRISSTTAFTGFIGCLGNGTGAGKVENLTLASAVVYSTDYVGGIASYNWGGTISNCTFGSSTTDDSSVSGTYTSGGVVAFTYGGSVSGCTNYGTVSASDNNSTYAGGIVAKTNDCTVSNCANYGTVSAASSDNETYSGGIVGWNENSTVSDCTNDGTVSSSSTYATAGGIVGANVNSTVSGCTNNGDASATGVYISAGGIVGWNENSTVSGCENTGDASGTGSKDTYLAGIVGFNSEGTVDETNDNKGTPITNVGNE